jgi:hypothetical protein
VALLLALACATATAAEPTRTEREDTDVVRSPASDAGFLDTPPFPELEVTDVVRGYVRTFVAPEARVGSGHVTLVRPQVGMRLAWPLNDRVGIRISGRVSSSRYRFRGGPTGVSPLLDDAVDLYAARFALEGSYRLAEAGPWFADEEVWSVLGSLSGGSRWEDGDFDSGLGVSGALGMGYQIPDRFRIGLGLTLRTSLEEGGLDPGPFVSMRWDVSERFTVRTEGLGLRLEYDVVPALELQVTGARASDGFRLHDRFGLRDDLTFRDRYLRFSGGFEWDLAKWLRLNLEAGYTAERRLRVQGDDLGTLVSKRVDPSLFFDIGIEVRL